MVRYQQMRSVVCLRPLPRSPPTGSLSAPIRLYEGATHVPRKAPTGFLTTTVSCITRWLVWKLLLAACWAKLGRRTAEAGRMAMFRSAEAMVDAGC